MGRLKFTFAEAHKDPVTCLLMIGANLFLSGGYDGTVR